MIRYCPTCSRSSKDARFIGEFCEFCIVEKVSKDFPSSAKVEYCKRCMRIKALGYYVENNKENMGAVLTKALNHKCKVIVNEYDDKSALVEVVYPVEDETVGFEKEIKLSMIHKICQDDYRKSSGYYEAVLQLRGSKHDIESMARRFTKFIETRGGFIARVDEVETGIDLYISDKIITKNFFLYNRLAPKASYTLFSIKNGRKVFRNTYLLKLE